MSTSGALAYTIRPSKGDAWRQLALVVDEGILWLEMVPAMLGWNVARSWIDGPDAWPKMTAAQIVAYRIRAGCFEPSTEHDATFAREWWAKQAPKGWEAV